MLGATSDLAMVRVQAFVLAGVLVVWPNQEARTAVKKTHADRSSISQGTCSRGTILRPARLPISGAAHVVPEKWKQRGFHYGVQELVEALQQAAKVVRQIKPTARLGIADLSAKEGGPSSWHQSHHSGRDVDILFYTMNERGKSQPPPSKDMIAFSGEGRPYMRAKEIYSDPNWKARRFDVGSNWELLASILTNPKIRVQWVFISRGLRKQLLSYAEKTNKPPWLRAYANMVMHQPGDSLPHDNHIHMRIYCPKNDRAGGCRDTGPLWPHEKKTEKYAGGEIYDPILARILQTRF